MFIPFHNLKAGDICRTLNAYNHDHNDDQNYVVMLFCVVYHYYNIGICANLMRRYSIKTGEFLYSKKDRLHGEDQSNMMVILSVNKSDKDIFRLMCLTINGSVVSVIQDVTDYLVEIFNAD